MAEKMSDEKAYEEFCKFLNKRIDFKESIMIEIELENLGMKDKTLEDFLEGEGIFQRMSKTEKLEKVGELKNFYSKRRGSGASEKSKLLESYRIILNDVNKEKEYDNYLKKTKYVGVNKILKNSKEVYKRDGRLKLNQIENYVSQINLKIKNESDARNIFYGFCRAERIPYDIQENQKNQSQNQNQNQSEKENERKNQSSTGSQSQQRNTGQNQNNNGNNRNSDNRSSNNRNNNNNWKSDTKKKKSSGAAFVWIIVAMLTIVIAVLAISKKDNQRQENRSQNVQQDISQKQTTNNTPKEEVSKEVSKEPEQTKEIPEKTDEEKGEEFLNKGILEYDKENITNAIVYFKKSAHFKNARAMYFLGEIYYNKGETEEAMRWYKDASDRGDLDAAKKYNELNNQNYQENNTQSEDDNQTDDDSSQSDEDNSESSSNETE
ncbi:sel1 repeat family protein [Leptotrichia sp. oral taxon 218]|uniref:sel1 repeat family protein n=1 Tax=Leptotrichia sp. oral taxon 218 TaxID=712361 RepID=UPI001B8D1B7F|nr:sel1 repeat family protein [Leptotrichia sp. oral taxon 218]QUB95997.1 sel1 repeat family protein [Leptotrichia sp. oral taxon 218]